MPPPPHCILGPPMTTGANDVWVFRIVHQDTGKPAPGVPVTVLDRAGNAEGHWVSDADGTVAIPRRETPNSRRLPGTSSIFSGSSCSGSAPLRRVPRREPGRGRATGP